MKIFVPHQVEMEERSDGAIILVSKVQLGPVAATTGEWLHHWAETAPERVFLAERQGESWREITYRDTLSSVRAIAQVLVREGMGAERPVAILSGNSINHGLLALACQYVGIPYSPVTEQYSLIPDAHPRLKYILGKVRPGLVYVEDAGQFASAISMEELADVKRVAARTDGPVEVTSFDTFLSGDDSINIDTLRDAVSPDTVAKILFTSGSTSNPKGVITTHRMMCVNQAQILACLPFLAEKPPVIVDWLPWNHVFGGSHNFNMMLANGGSLFIDNGKPVKPLFDITVQNIGHKKGNISFNVPLGFANLVEALNADDTLRREYFEQLDMLFYAGAALPQDTWNALEDLARKDGGEPPLMTSSWGMTETAPACLLTHQPMGKTGIIGVPLPGVTVKLIPDDDMRCELRVKGPNVTPGYHEDPAKTNEAFDEEGFLITGDAVRFVTPGKPEDGVFFDGRTSEDFKLTSGTWVTASKLRLETLPELGGIAQDIVICGQDRNEVSIMIFPLPAVREQMQEDDGALTDDKITTDIKRRLVRLAERASGSATRITAALVLAEPPSVGDGEITDKGYINSGKVRSRRKELVERLYDRDDPATITV